MSRYASLLAFLASTLLVTAANGHALYSMRLLEPGHSGTEINDSGAVTGYASVSRPDGSFTGSAFRWTPEQGAVYAPITPPGSWSTGVGIDAEGHVVGMRERRNHKNFVYRWDGAANATRVARGFVSSGNAAGDATGFDSLERAMIWTADGGSISVDAPFIADAIYLNDHRLVVGMFEGNHLDLPELAVWSPKLGVRMLGHPANHPTMRMGPADVSNTGIIVGNGYDFFHPEKRSNAFRWTASTGYTFLGRLDACYDSGATAVNDGGTIVGETTSWSSGHGCGWIWTEAEGMRLLYDVIDPTDSRREEILFQRPRAINNRGQILGVGFRGPSEVTYILTPMQPPN